MRLLSCDAFVDQGPSADTRPAWVEHCLELLAPLRSRTRAGRMFGGWALHVDGLCVALLLHEQLYLKADEAGRAAFAAAGCTPFIHDGARGPVTTSQGSAPADAMHAPALMVPWSRLAQRAALAAKARPAKPRRARPKPAA